MWNKNLFSRIVSSLYWKISATFLGILIIVGFAYICVTAYSADMYFQEINQRLNGAIAQKIRDEVSLKIEDGEVDQQAVKNIMQYMMVLSPSLEVYLLDTEGKILTYVAPAKRVKLTHVNLTPVKQFLSTNGNTFITGEDPRNVGVKKVFSAAPLQDEGKLQGYIYVILASEAYDSKTQLLLGSYILQVGLKAMLVTLIAALVIGLLAIWFLTKNLRIIIKKVNEFENGNLNARIELKSQGELTTLAANFNNMADTILASIEELKLTQKLRRELIANVSHDLRTPLAIIHGYIETLKMKEDSLTAEERAKYTDIILKSTDKLKKLVSELFELSKLEAHQVKPNKEPFFIAELIHDTSQRYRIMAKDKNIKIKVDATNDLPLVLADISLIERVLQNLLDNAIKFTPTGGNIAIKLAKKEEKIEIKVADNGIGIAADAIPHVFDRYQTKNKVKYNKGGTGLGLAIVKRILELHNSDIHLQSQPNVETSFTFQLPIFGV